MSNSSNVTAGTNATATQYNNLRKDTLLGIKDPASQTNNGAIDLNVTNDYEITLNSGSALPLVPANATTGQWFAITLIQDATGGRTVTWFSGIKWPGGTAPSLSSAANAVDTFIFKCTGAGTYRGYFGGFGLA